MSIGVETYFYRFLRDELHHLIDLHKDTLCEGGFENEAQARFCVGFIRGLKEALSAAEMIQEKISEM